MTMMTNSTSSLLGMKILISFGTFLICFFSAAAPLKVISVDDNLFSVGNMIASGVLFAAGLVHQLPDSSELLEGVYIFGTDDFPLAPFIAGLTFTFFLILEEYLHTHFDDIMNNSSNNPSPIISLQHHIHDDDHHQRDDDGHNHHHHHDEKSKLIASSAVHDCCEMNNQKLKKATAVGNIVAEAMTTFVSCTITNDGSGCKDDRCREKCSVFLCTSNVKCNDTTNCRNKNTCGQYLHRDRSVSIGSTMSSYGETNDEESIHIHRPGETSMHGHSMRELKTSMQKMKHRRHHSRSDSMNSSCSTGGMIPIINDALESMKDYHFSHEHPIHYQEEHLADHASTGLLSSILLMVALSFHSFIEQVAIGVATNTSQLASTSAAVFAHKAFAGYALGSALVASHMKQSHILLLIFVFSSCSIVGVFLGIVILQVQQSTAIPIDGDNQGTAEVAPSTSTTTTATVPTIGIVQAMVTGTFLYVSIVEIAMKELMTHRDSCKNNNDDGGGDSHTHDHRHNNVLPAGTWQIRKLIAFLIGYIIMSLLAIWV